MDEKKVASYELRDTVQQFIGLLGLLEFIGFVGLIGLIEFIELLELLGFAESIQDYGLRVNLLRLACLPQVGASRLTGEIGTEN